jgi:hypothetical protein
MGLISDRDLLLTGPSNFGLAEPGHSASISLMQMSVSLGMLNLTLDNLVTMQVMQHLVDEIGQEFGKAHDQLIQDDARTNDGL